MKYSPTPWTARVIAASGYGEIRDANDQHIARVHHRATDTDASEVLANTKLLGSVPALFAACEALLWALKVDTNCLCDRPETTCPRHSLMDSVQSLLRSLSE